MLGFNNVFCNGLVCRRLVIEHVFVKVSIPILISINVCGIA